MEEMIFSWWNCEYLLLFEKYAKKVKKVQKKSHYDDDAWIIRTAISQYENDDGVYSDIYEVVGNISEKMP